MIFDDCYKSILEKLTSQGKIIQVSRDLMSKTKNYERVLFVYNLLKEQNTFPKLKIVKKCRQLSLLFRTQGNQWYQVKQLYKAWQYYNLSLLLAPLNSDAYYLAISNRSAVFFELEKYNECEKDVQYVLNLNIPNDLKEKMRKREKLCAAELLKRINIRDENDETFDNLKLKGERNSVYMCASSKIEVKFSKEMGRQVIAREDIKVGEVFADEKPYVTIVNMIQMTLCCSHCLSRDFNLLPCDNCCFSLYCSEECKSQAFKEYHKIECPLMASLAYIDFTELLLALRIVIKARSDHEDWNGLFQTIDKAELNIGTKYHGQVKVDDKWVYDSKYYTSIHTSERNVDTGSAADIFHKSMMAAVFLKFLEEHTTFLNASNNEDLVKIKQIVAGTLLIHMTNVTTNMHSISSNVKNQYGECKLEMRLASGVYAFYNLFNHSCAPNVKSFNDLGKKTVKLVVIRPIKKGMQLFVNYRVHYALQQYPEREQFLKSYFKFDCQCEACVNNWPTYRNMYYTSRIPPNLKTIVDKLLLFNHMDIERGNKKTAIKIFGKLCKLCEDLDPYTPCRELNRCQEFLMQCLRIFEGWMAFDHIPTVTLDALLK